MLHVYCFGEKNLYLITPLLNSFALRKLAHAKDTPIFQKAIGLHKSIKWQEKENALFPFLGFWDYIPNLLYLNIKRCLFIHVSIAMSKE